MIGNSWMHLKRGIQKMGNIFKKMYLKIYVLYLKRKSRYTEYQVLSLSGLSGYVQTTNANVNTWAPKQYKDEIDTERKTKNEN